MLLQNPQALEPRRQMSTAKLEGASIALPKEVSDVAALLFLPELPSETPESLFETLAALCGILSGRFSESLLRGYGAGFLPLSSISRAR